MTTRLLIVEDDAEIAALLTDYLEQSGYATTVVADGAEAMTVFQSLEPAMILLDVALPKVDGFSLCRQIRANSSVPIMMITARVEEIDRLLGLELGADDYVCKPFSPREVVARVKAILRRGDSEQMQPQVVLDHQAFCARCGHRRIEMTRTEFGILTALIEHPQRVFSRDQLSDFAYPDGRVVVDRTIDSHIKNIRRKLEEAGCPGAIKSVYGVGYRYEP